jgi:hypothetical protein
MLLTQLINIQTHTEVIYGSRITYHCSISNNITDMLLRTWKELEYREDSVSATKGAHTEV